MPRRPNRDLTDPGAMLGTLHELAGGLRIGLRLTRPSDAPRVRAFLERLSPETRLRRFLVATPEIEERQVQLFTFYNPRERLVLAATAPVEGAEEIIGLADVETRLLGPEGAIHVFGPQKGLQSDQIESLDRELTRLVDRVKVSLGSNHSETIRSGAAGGFGYGILTFLRGKLVSGFAEVAQRLRLLTRISAADVVITGEGKLDRQSLQGKGPFGVAEIARRVKKPIWVIAGTIEDTERIQEHFDKAISVVDQSITLEAALKDPAGALRQRAAAFWK